jgi:hypothetical protein
VLDDVKIGRHERDQIKMATPIKKRASTRAVKIETKLLTSEHRYAFCIQRKKQSKSKVSSFQDITSSEAREVHVVHLRPHLDPINNKTRSLNLDLKSGVHISHDVC